jgi:DNA-binding IclR family transcriptional regulator
MSRAAETGTDDGNPLPPGLDTAQLKLVYLYLRVSGTGTTGELREALNMRLLTLYPVLRTLVRMGYVRREEGAYRLADR